MPTATDPRPHCPACGSPVNAALRTCSWCGATVDVPVGPVFVAPPTDHDRSLASDEAPAGRSGHRRRRWLAGGGAAVLAAAAVTTVVLLSGGDGAGTAPVDRRAQDARDVASALSALAKDPASLRATSGALGGLDARAAVPSGTTVTADEKSWSPDGAGGGVMTVSLTAPDGTQTRYLVVLVHEDAGWRVLQTFPAAPATTASVTPTAVTS